MTTQFQQQARQFRQLHTSATPLILPNAWDAISARVLELSGAQALATSSCAISWAHGYADGGHLPLALHLQSIAAIKRVTSLPLSVDVEDGYASHPQQVAKHVAAFVEAGAVAINIEDGQHSAELLVEKILAIRAELGAELYINARCDLLLQGQLQGAALVDEIVSRAALYQQAGADAIFLPGLHDLALIRQLCQHSALPINLMALPNLAPAAELAQAGVQRISMGGFLLQAALAQTQQLVQTSLASGRFQPLFAQSLDYGSLNQALAGMN